MVAGYVYLISRLSSFPCEGGWWPRRGRAAPGLGRYGSSHHAAPPGHPREFAWAFSDWHRKRFGSRGGDNACRRDERRKLQLARRTVAAAGRRVLPDEVRPTSTCLGWGRRVFRAGAEGEGSPAGGSSRAAAAAVRGRTGRGPHCRDARGGRVKFPRARCVARVACASAVSGSSTTRLTRRSGCLPHSCATCRSRNERPGRAGRPGPALGVGGVHDCLPRDMPTPRRHSQSLPKAPSAAPPPPKPGDPTSRRTRRRSRRLKVQGVLLRIAAQPLRP